MVCKRCNICRANCHFSAIPCHTSGDVKRNMGGVASVAWRILRSRITPFRLSNNVWFHLNSTSAFSQKTTIPQPSQTIAIKRKRKKAVQKPKAPHQTSETSTKQSKLMSAGPPLQPRLIRALEKQREKRKEIPRSLWQQARTSNLRIKVTAVFLKTCIEETETSRKFCDPEAIVELGHV